MQLTASHCPCLCPLSTLSQCCHAVVALLYPFVWQHTYIPVLPTAMLDIVCTPTPFIVGLLSSTLPQLTELPLEEVREPLTHLSKHGIRFITYKNGNGKILYIIMITVFHVQVLVVDLGNNRFLRQVGHAFSHVCVGFFFL